MYRLAAGLPELPSSNLRVSFNTEKAHHDHPRRKATIYEPLELLES